MMATLSLLLGASGPAREPLGRMLNPVPATAADFMNCRREMDWVGADVLGNVVMAEPLREFFMVGEFVFRLVKWRPTCFRRSGTSGDCPVCLD
jgi:hypothetical protein